MIQSYNEFLSYEEDSMVINMLEKYVNNEITFETFNEHFITMNESFLSNIKDKVLSMMNYLGENISRIGTKAINIAKTIFNMIKNFEKKYPKFCKIVLLLLVFLLVASATAMASIDTDPSRSIKTIESAVGYLEYLRTNNMLDDLDPNDIHKAQSALLSIKQNLAKSISDPELKTMFGEYPVKIANQAMNTIKRMNEEGKTNIIFDCWKIGKKMIVELDIKIINGVKDVHSTIKTI